MVKNVMRNPLCVTGIFFEPITLTNEFTSKVTQCVIPPKAFGGIFLKEPEGLRIPNAFGTMTEIRQKKIAEASCLG